MIEASMSNLLKTFQASVLPARVSEQFYFHLAAGGTSSSARRFTVLLSRHLIDHKVDDMASIVGRQRIGRTWRLRCPLRLSTLA